MNNPQQNPQEGQQGQQGQQGNDMFAPARQIAEQKVDEAIDQFAHKIPGGDKFSQQAKDAANNALENLEQQAEQQLEQRLGGIFGHHNNPNNQ